MVCGLVKPADFFYGVIKINDKNVTNSRYDIIIVIDVN